MAKSFQIGSYRPIYLWGGPGTIRMNRLKFMDQPVDEEAHFEAHRPDGARRVLEEIYSNWIHLTYDWGFPPEIEAEDWLEFEKAAVVYKSGGGKVFAYIQMSNCVFAGSYLEKEWYARDPQGRKIFYSPVFKLPDEPARQALLAALPGGLHPRVRSADPVLIEAWRCDGENQVHLVNYLERPQIVQVSFGAPVVATVISPDRSIVLTLRGEVMQIEVDIYSVLKVVGE